MTRCENCSYHYAEPGDKYPHCHYESLGIWDPSPCEYDDDEGEDE